MTASPARAIVPKAALASRNSPFHLVFRSWWSNFGAMASAAAATISPSPNSRNGPTLEPGDTLTRDEFERRYERMRGVKKAELIEGIVYMPSPLRAKAHAQPHVRLAG